MKSQNMPQRPKGTNLPVGRESTKWELFEDILFRYAEKWP